MLVSQQCGFRKNLSTTMATHNLLKVVLDALNNNSLIGGISCDLKRAFDCVNHGTLLSKKEFYGIKDIFYNLIKSYLNNGYQRVVIRKSVNKYYSDWQPVRYGVPQGSILGPLFFLLYNNDLPSVISDMSKPVLYADNTSIIC
jgi:hypothetical protein